MTDVSIFESTNKKMQNNSQFQDIIAYMIQNKIKNWKNKRFPSNNTNDTQKENYKATKNSGNG